MKRQKGKCPNPESFKRQKSCTDDKLLGRENANDEGHLEHANLYANADLQVVNKNAIEENKQVASGDIQKDDELVYRENTKEYSRGEHEINLARKKPGNAAKEQFCGSSSTIKPNDNGRRGKSQPGFGFTKETGQFRSNENRKRSSNNSNRNVRKKSVEKTNATKQRSESRDDLVTGIVEKSVNVTSTVTNCCKALESVDIEMDVINTSEVNEKTLNHAPEQARSDYADMSPKNLPTNNTMTFLCMIPKGKQKPDDETSILIPHPKADRPEGDYFGADLSTYIDKHEPKYYRHFLVGVIKGPAKEMRIRENDELVLVNWIFVPDLAHADVLNLFHHVQVDGKTRFSLVVRRVVDKKWQWIETSAVLVPEKSPDTGPIIKRADYRRLEGEAGKIVTPISRHLYKVPGTQKYLEITKTNICIDVLKEDSADSNKIIWKQCMFWPSDYAGQINFVASLCDESKTHYIGMDKTKSCIVLKNKPEWFKLVMIGRKVRFQLKDQYLGYDRESGEIKAQKGDCVFEEFPASTLEELKDHHTSLATPFVGIDNVDGNIASHHSPASSLQDVELEFPNRESIQSSCNPENMSIMLNDGYDNNSSPRSSEEVANLSQSSNDSDRSAYDEYGNVSLGTNSSGYGSLSLSPPESLEVSDNFDPGISELVKKNGSKIKNQPKTPTTPMVNLTLSTAPVLQ